MGGMFGMSGGSQTETVLTDEQRRVLNEISRLVLGEIGQPGDVYPGQIVPGASDLQQQGFGHLSSYLGSDALQSMLSGQPAWTPDPAARGRVYDAAEATAMNQLQSRMLPLLEERFNAMGAGRSGGLQQSMTNTAGDVTLGLGQLRAGLEYQDETARRGAMENAANRQGAGLGMYGQGIQNLMAGGQTQRNIQGQQFGEQFGKWMSGLPEYNPMLGLLPQVLGTQAMTSVNNQDSILTPWMSGGKPRWQDSD